MKLYKITNLSEHPPYAEFYDSIIVCAKDENDARTIHPYLPEIDHDHWKYGDAEWPKKKSLLAVKHIGEAVSDIPRGVIMCDYKGY